MNAVRPLRETPGANSRFGCKQPKRPNLFRTSAKPERTENNSSVAFSDLNRDPSPPTFVDKRGQIGTIRSLWSPMLPSAFEGCFSVRATDF